MRIGDGAELAFAKKFIQEIIEVMSVNDNLNGGIKETKPIAGFVFAVNRLVIDAQKFLHSKSLILWLS